MITAAHYGCLRPAIAEARTLVCEFPVLAGKRPPMGGRVRTAMLEKKQTTALPIQRSHLGLFRDLQRVIDLYAEISHCNFELRVPE